MSLAVHDSPEAFRDNLKELHRQGKPLRECLKTAVELNLKAQAERASRNPKRRLEQRGSDYNLTHVRD